METIDHQDPMEPLRREPSEVRNIIERVLKLEAARLFQERPHPDDRPVHAG